MRSTAFYTGMLVLCPVLLFAQPRWKLVNWHAELLMWVGGSGLLTMEQLSAQTRSAAFPYPGSQSMDKEPSILPIAASGSLALTAGFYPYSRKRGCYNGRKEWQVGVFFRYMGLPASNYGRRGGGYPDRVIYVGASFSQTRPVAGIRNAFTFRTDPTGSVNIFGGASLDLGISFSGRIWETYSQDVQVPVGSGYQIHTDKVASRRYPARPLLLSTFRLYYGLGVRLSRSYLSFTSGIEVGALRYFPSPVAPIAGITGSVNVSIPLYRPEHSRQGG